MIATYNERQNLEPLYRRIRELPIEVDLLVVDDNSPDGTGVLAERLASEESVFHVMRRPGRMGIGNAHLDGIRWAYAHGYKRLVTMDCDFTHQPEDIPLFLARSDSFDVVIGTRFMDPRSLEDWDPFRKIVTYFAHFLTQKLLNMSYDASGAFRVYRLDRIPRDLFDLVTASGYAFFFQSLFVLSVNGFSIQEIPIVLPARTCGHSKMTAADAVKGLLQLMVTFFDSRFRHSRYVLIQKTKRHAHA